MFQLLALLLQFIPFSVTLLQLLFSLLQAVQSVVFPLVAVSLGIQACPTFTCLYAVSMIYTINVMHIACHLYVKSALPSLCHAKRVYDYNDVSSPSSLLPRQSMCVKHTLPAIAIQQDHSGSG